MPFEFGYLSRSRRSPADALHGDQRSRPVQPATRQADAAPRVESAAGLRHRLSLMTTGETDPTPAEAGLRHAAPLQRMVDRKMVESEMRPITLDWIRSGKQGETRYAAVGKDYEALLKGLDTYHDAMGATTVLSFEDAGVAKFQSAVSTAIGELRLLCKALKAADKLGELADVVAYVVHSLDSEEETVTDIATVFTKAVAMLARRGWNAQFADKSYARAVEIAEFSLPLYRAGYFAERSFIAKGAFDSRSMPTKGYKLHVSVHKDSMTLARDIVMPVLDKRGGLHKIVADPADLTGPQAGKVITIYPMTEDEATKADGFEALIGTIDTLLAARALPGPAVQGEEPVGSKRYVFRESNAALTQTM
jgi:hypothetical protein